MSLEFLIQRTENAKDLPLPARATVLASGLDLRANIFEEVKLEFCERILVPTGIKIALPSGYEAQIRPRSGLALKSGVTLFNSVGTIDADYRGEINAILINFDKTPFIIKRGDRIAQMVICPVALVDFTEIETLPQTVRGEGGFGHTGT